MPMAVLSLLDPESVVRRKLSDLRETAAVIEPATLELAADA